MWKGKKISVVLPAYNEEKNIRKAVDGFFKTGVVDEVVVVNNNSKDKTFEEARKTKAKIVNELNQGYGWSLRRGLYEARGDYIFTCEPDATFVAEDIFKFLAYSEEFDVIFGTRTSKSLIWDGANMGWFLRMGNTAVAKLLEYLHNGPCLTDVGCTFKFIKKESLKKIQKKFTVGKSHFSPEFMILCLRNGLKCVEIPVNYRGRVGESKITGSFWKAWNLGWKMIFMIIGYKFGMVGKNEDKSKV
jgi:glycosyltransferase involved in cell wall biosynthesis